jgi:hypothetical protein
MSVGALVGVTALTLPGTLGDFQRRLPLNLHFVLFETPYLWDRHVTIRAFWRLLLQGYAVGESRPLTVALTSLCTVGLGALLFWAALRTREARSYLPANGRRFDRLIAATIVATPLLMPFYFDYDQLLLAIPAVLFAVEVLDARRYMRGDDGPVRLSVVVGLWSVWYGWLMINPDVASITHFNGTVLLLSALSVAMASRALRATRLPMKIPNRNESAPRALAA